MSLSIGMKLKDRVYGYVITVTAIGSAFATVTHTNGVFYFTLIRNIPENFEVISE